jgi:hypothetical protein
MKRLALIFFALSLIAPSVAFAECPHPPDCSRTSNCEF